MTNSQLGKVVAAMQEPFPVLTHLELRASMDEPDVLVLPRFLGGSAPCLQQVHLSGIPFPELPTLLLLSCDLVSLQLESIPPTGYISPEAMVAGLAVLTRLKTFRIRFRYRISPPEQRTRHPYPLMRAVLPVLTEFEFRGRSEYLEDLVAQLDTPRLDDVWTIFDRLDSLRLPQLSLFIVHRSHRDSQV